MATNTNIPKNYSRKNNTITPSRPRPIPIYTQLRYLRPCYCVADAASVWTATSNPALRSGLPSSSLMMETLYACKNSCNCFTVFRDKADLDNCIISGSFVVFGLAFFGAAFFGTVFFGAAADAVVVVFGAVFFCCHRLFRCGLFRCRFLHRVGFFNVDNSSSIIILVRGGYAFGHHPLGGRSRIRFRLRGHRHRNGCGLWFWWFGFGFGGWWCLFGTDLLNGGLHVQGLELRKRHRRRILPVGIHGRNGLLVG